MHASTAQANQAFDQFAKELAFMLDPAARAGKFLESLANGQFLTNLQDMFYGWADGLTGDLTKYYRQAIGGDFTNYDSVYYQIGNVAGIAHGFALSFAGGAACAPSWATTAARGYTSFMSAWNTVHTGYRVYSGQEELSWWHTLTFAPAAGYGLGRLGRALGLFGCFVGDTEVCYLEAGSSIWFVSAAGILALGTAGMIVAERRHGKCRKEQESPVDDAFGNPADGDAWRLDSDTGDPGSCPENLEVLCDKVFYEEGHSEWHGFSAHPLDYSEADAAFGSRDGLTVPTSTATACHVSCSICSRAPAIRRSAKPRTGTRPAASSTPAPRAGRQRTRRRVSRVGLAGFFTALLLSALCMFQGATSVHVATKPIAQFTVGMEVPPDRIRGDNDLSQGERVDPQTWKRLELRAPKQDGSWAEITMLVPPEWLAAQAPRVGGTVEISVFECGIDGLATVLSIGPCPKIQNLGGNVVTAVFKHHSTRVLDLYVEGLDAPIGTTANHPFWSEDREEYVRADELQEGERLAAFSGTPRVVAVVPRPGLHTVYNLEIHRDHVYSVTSQGVLVHNVVEGRHHFMPFSWGNLIPRGNKALPFLSTTDHTDIHRAFSNFLHTRTGYRFRSLTKKQWQARFSINQRNKLVHDFMRDFSNTAEGRRIAHNIQAAGGWGKGNSLYEIFLAQQKYAKRFHYLRCN